MLDPAPVSSNEPRKAISPRRAEQAQQAATLATPPTAHTTTAVAASEPRWLGCSGSPDPVMPLSPNFTGRAPNMHHHMLHAGVRARCPRPPSFAKPRNPTSRRAKDRPATFVGAPRIRSTHSARLWEDHADDPPPRDNPLLVARPSCS